MIARKYQFQGALFVRHTVRAPAPFALPTRDLSVRGSEGERERGRQREAERRAQMEREKETAKERKRGRRDGEEPSSEANLETSQSRCH